MRFQISLVQERANGGGGNGQNNVSLDDFIRQFFGRPVCHRSAAVVRRFAGHRDDLGEFFGTEFTGRAAPRYIAEQLDDGCPQRTRPFREFR